MPDSLDAYLDPAPKRNPRERVHSIASRIGLDPSLADDYLRVTQVESSHNVNVRDSSKGAKGFGQVMPDRPGATTRTVSGRRYNLRDPEQNIEAGLRLFSAGGADPVARRLEYFGGAGARRKYERTGRIPNISDGNMTAAQYVRATGGRQSPQSQSLKPVSDLDSYLDPVTEQSLPDSKQNSVPPVQTATSPAGFPRKQATPSRSYWGRVRERMEEAQPASIPAATGKRGELLRRLGQQRTIEQSQREQEEATRKQVEQEYRGRRGAYGAPTPTGVAHLIFNPIESFTGLFKSDEENIARETQERLKQQQVAAEPEVQEIRKEYGEMSVPRRVATSALAKGGAGLLDFAGGLAELGGLLPKGVIPPADQLSNWAKKRAEIIEAGASGAPLREKRNLSSLITGETELEEVERGVPEKVAQGVADLGVGLGDIILLKRATRLPFNKLLALEAAARNSEKPIDQQLSKTAEAYALGTALDRHLSRPVSAAISGIPTAAQTSYEVSQGRMSPLDAGIATGIQTLQGAILTTPPSRGRARPVESVAEPVTVSREQPVEAAVVPVTNPRLREIDAELAQIRQQLRDVPRDAPATELDRRLLELTGERERLSEQVETQPDVEAQSEAAQPRSATPEVDAGRVAVQGQSEVVAAQSRAADTELSASRSQPATVTEVESVPSAVQETGVRGADVVQRFYHTQFENVVKHPDQSGARRGKVKIYVEGKPDEIHYVKKVDLRGRGNERMVPLKGEPAEKPIDDYLEPQDEPAEREFSRKWRDQLAAYETLDAEGRKAYEDTLRRAGRESDLDTVRRKAAEEEEADRKDAALVDEATKMARIAGEAGDEGSALLSTFRLRESPIPESTTAAKNAAIAQDRAALDLPELAQVEPRKATEVHARAVEANRTNPRATDILTEQALRGGKNFTDVETAQVRLRAQEIKNRVNELNQELAEADPTIVADKAAEIDSLVNEFDRLSQATRAAGTEWGRAGVARQQAIDQDFNLVSMIANFRRAKRGVETPEERARIEDLQQRLVKAETERDVANERAAQAELQKVVNRISRTRQRRESRQTLDDEFAQLKAQFAQARAETRNVQASGLAGLDPEGRLTRLIGQMARNRIRAGVTDAAQLVDDIHAAIVEHLPEVDKRTVRDAISGYSIAPKTKRSELQKQIDALRSELQTLSKTEDIETGVRSPHREGPKQSEARQLPMEGPRKSDERRSGIPRQGPKLSDTRKLPAEGPRLSEAPKQGPRPREGWRLTEGPKLSKGEGRTEGPRLSEGQGRKQGPRIEDAPFVGPRQSDARRLSMEGPRLSDAPLQGPHLSDARRVPEQGPKMVEHGPPKRLFTRDQQRRRQLEKQITELERRMREQDFSEPERKPPAYTRETLRLTKEVEQIKATYNRMRYKATRGRGGIISDELAKAANVPKTLKSIGDISAVFRQGGYYALTHPIEGGLKPTREMLRSFTELGWRNVEATIKADTDYPTLRDAGVEFTGVDKADPNLSRREEGFLGGEYLDLIAKGKYNYPGKFVKGVKDVSERTFVSFLDAQRLYVGKQILKGMTEAQRGNPRELEAVGKLINAATGRGNLGKRGNQLAPALNVLMFSPRLLVSRVQLLNNMVSPRKLATMPPGARRAMIKDNAKFVGATIAILTLAKAAGATVSLDPDDAEFLKVRIGNTVYDQLTGLQQPLRTIINLARAATPSALSSQRLQTGDYYAGKSMKEILDPFEEGSFTRSKLNPAISPLIDFSTGTDFMGREFSAGREAGEMLTPLFAKDIVEGFQSEGALGAVKATPSAVGIGVGSYPPSPEKPKTHAEKMARRLARPPDSGPRTDTEIETDRQRAQLRARSRRGEDVSADITALGSKITERQAKAILSARNKTRLYEDVNRLGIKDALMVYKVANADQRANIKPLLNRKASLADTLKPEEQATVKAMMAELGLGSGRTTRPTRSSRESRATRQ